MLKASLLYLKTIARFDEMIIRISKNLSNYKVNLNEESSIFDKFHVRISFLHTKINVEYLSMQEADSNMKFIENRDSLHRNSLEFLKTQSIT